MMEKWAEIERSIIKKYKKTVWNRFIGACKDYKLVESGDVIAVCISGGKDSFLLAECMRELQKYSEIPFELRFLCMDPGYNAENRALIEKNAADMQIPLTIFETDIFNSVEKIEQNPCYLCARMRRGYLYKNAKLLGCNKIALGHHFDDVIETTLMSMLWGAEIKTMMPKLHSTNYEGMQLIRPLYHVREADVLAWKRYNSLTFLQCACRFTENLSAENAQHGARSETKALIAALKKANPQADINIFRSMQHVNFDCVLGGKQGEKEFTFLDEY